MGIAHTCRAAVVAAVVLHLAVAAPAPPDPYPVPDPLPPLSAATLDDRYAATQRALTDALAVARARGDRVRAAALDALRGRHLLDLDARGTGRVVEVLGDLGSAQRIVVMVPGSHTTVDTFDRRRGPGGAARALADQIRAYDPDSRVAVVAWLGYATPQGLSYQAVTDHLARSAAGDLRATVAGLRAVKPAAPVSLLCHSYGSVVCATAMIAAAGAGVPAPEVADLVLYGSPGVVADHVAELAAAGTRVWVGRAANDWIRHLPPVRIGVLGFGTDPMSPHFGGRVFAAGCGGHGDYHLRGSVPLRSLALIALGRTATGGRPGVSGRVCGA